MPVNDQENKTKAEMSAKEKAAAKAKRLAEAHEKAKATKGGTRKIELIEGLRVTSGPVPADCVRVKVLRPHDGNGPRCFYRPGEIVDIYQKYYEQQTTPTDENGHKWTVKPPVFELVE